MLQGASCGSTVLPGKEDVKLVELRRKRILAWSECEERECPEQKELQEERHRGRNEHGIPW